MKKIDQLLNSYTMYKVVLCGLICLAIASILFGAFSIIYFSSLSQLLSLVILLSSCYYSNLLFAKMANAKPNVESALITAFILFFLLIPPAKTADVLVTIFAGILAMASKYIFNWRHAHIFNPAAIAAFVVGLLGFGNVIWWVGSDVLLPFTILVGFMIIRKLRKTTMFLLFLAFSQLSIASMSIINGTNLFATLTESLVSWPIFFFGTVMLTEPLTMPSTKKYQHLYAAFIGLVFGLQFQIGPLYSTPELSLVIGNLLAFIHLPVNRLTLRLENKRLIAKDTYELTFAHENELSFQSGQYMEWTLPHLSPDSRGNRRYFTIASAPSARFVSIIVRINENASSFKRKLKAMKNGEEIEAAQVAGDFILPKEKNKKIVLLAGGIGVTPFISMISELVVQNERRDIILMYFNSHESEIACRELLDSAQKKIGIKIHYYLTDIDQIPKKWVGGIGRLTQETLKNVVPDLGDRYFYISGPNAMVDSQKAILHELNIPSKRVKTDYFPGF